MLRASFPLLFFVSICVAIPSTFGADQQVIQYGENGQENSALKVREELRKAEIIPTVLDDFMPVMTLKIAWPWGDTSSYNLTSKLGNTLDPDLLQRSPHAYLNADPTSSADFITVGQKKNERLEKPKKKYPEIVLTMTDPDAPSRDDPKWSEMCHWIVAVRLPDDIDEVVEYKPPGPPPRTGKHRYVFTAWIAANRTSAKLRLEKPGDRKRWGYGKGDRDAGRVGVRRWAEENGLEAFAANFIYAQNEKQ